MNFKQQNKLITGNIAQQNRLIQEQMIQNLMTHMQQYRNLDQIKKHLIKANQTALFSLLSNEISQITNNQEVILQNFYRKFYQRIKQTFPALFKNQQKLSQIDQINLFIKQLQNNEPLFEKLKLLLKHHEDIELELRSIFQKQQQIKDQKNKSKQIKKNGMKKTNKRKIQDQIKKNVVSQHAYVRLYPKTQQSMQYLMKNNKVPRLELQINIHQPLKYLVDYLCSKWLKQKSHKILIYPDSNHYLKSYKQKSTKKTQPLNNLLMITDILSGYDWPANNIIALQYQIVTQQDKIQKKKDLLKIKQPKKKQVLEMVQQQKYNPYSEDNTQKNIQNINIPNSGYDQLHLLIDHKFELSNNFNDSCGIHSLFKKGYQNSNPQYFNAFHNSNSILEFKSKKNEGTMQHNTFESLRETIKLIQREDSKINGEDSFKGCENSVKFQTVPIIKRKSFI